ncbi:MAG: DUF4838 domain-containing protein [Capnocytophaga sp.]|nr:DUF4838 domain-containing protein [Capnocytophaga sp.]
MKIGVKFIILWCMIFSVPKQKTEDKVFTYREVYFPMVSAASEYSIQYGTMPLDSYWGLWGHNLNKWVERSVTSENMHAMVDGKYNLSQYCFSSEELLRIIEKNIDSIKNTYKYYMILPNDNAVVCQCNQCKRLGNTDNDASPAVFHLLQKLSAEIPQVNFFTTAYRTVRRPPAKKMPPNIGVLISTIEYQEGVPYSQLKNHQELSAYIRSWTKHVEHVWAWEYALNYDNYFDLYPNLEVFNENLLFLSNYGVSGVFVNGSETYSVLQDVKCSIMAQMLTDSTTPVEEMIRTEIYQRYPGQIAPLLSEYYITINKDFHKSKRYFGIYSGIRTAEKKYLSAQRYYDFYKAFAQAYHTVENPDTNTQQLMLALAFMRLELMRSFGAGELGYATAKDAAITIHSDVIGLLETVSNLSKQTQTDTYNEVGSTIEAYLDNWAIWILNQTGTNHLLNRPIEVLSDLDEEYSDTRWLNDGAYGFLDYNTNWLICSQDDLIIRIDSQYLKDSQHLEIGFLNDPVHHIYFPQTITIYDDSTSGEYELQPTGELTKQKVHINLLPYNNDTHVYLKIKRLKNHAKSAIACDEIVAY